MRSMAIGGLSMSLKLLFTCPITGEDVDAYVFGPIENPQRPELLLKELRDVLQRWEPELTILSRCLRYRFCAPSARSPATLWRRFSKTRHK